MKGRPFFARYSLSFSFFYVFFFFFFFFFEKAHGTFLGVLRMGTFFFFLNNVGNNFNISRKFLVFVYLKIINFFCHMANWPGCDFFIYRLLFSSVPFFTFS